MAIKNKKRDVINDALKNVKMEDAGIKEKPMRGVPTAKARPYIDYPTLYLNVKQAPGLSNYEVEDDIKMVLEGKIISHNKNTRRGSEGRETFDIEIRKLGCFNK